MQFSQEFSSLKEIIKMFYKKTFPRDKQVKGIRA